ncbi:hypothetical protein H4R18_005047 [Coemansia javaensis]|uniref:Uncharacterized protein n=1 Tax=Coemansia javaensis TaxID=2761396 RepID=A0A9W8H9V5_9FUNG|nr:hypothetical protein H4R18_005047 [Coemansia javaensis]
MRLSLIVAQALAATALAAPALVRRQAIEAEAGDSVSGGPSAISNPTINNGDMIDSSLITNGSEGEGDLVNNAFGNSITHINSNQANKDNLVINPTFVSSGGNSGSTANGNQNHLGDSQDVYPGFIRRRDAIVTNASFNPQFAAGFGYPQAAYAPVFAGYQPPTINGQVQNAAIIQNQA